MREVSQRCPLHQPSICRRLPFAEQHSRPRSDFSRIIYRASQVPVRVNVTDHRSKKSDHLPDLPVVEKLEEEIKSHFYELRNGKIGFSDQIKGEHRRLKTSLFRYLLHSRFFAFITSPFIYVCIVPFCAARSLRFHIPGRVFSRLRH